AKDVVTGLDLLERRFVYGRAPDRNVVDDLHGALLVLSTFFGGTCGDRTHLVLIKSQVPLRFGIGSETGTGVEDRTLLIFFVGEARSPDDNPGLVPAPGLDPGSRR